MNRFNQTIFIDSGAHGLYNEFVIRKQHKEGYSFYDSKDFWDYVDAYALFIQKNKLEIYANVDVIFKPLKTWEVQQYLEKKWKLTPIPVIHFGTDLKWLKRYLKRGYDYIALGGLGQDTTKNEYIEWADRAFSVICAQPNHLPKVKVHGFAMTSFTLMTRYPWYSVDSTSWLKFAAYGFIIIPAFRQGDWNYSIPFFVIKVTVRMAKVGGLAIASYKEASLQLVNAYLKEKGYVLGKSIIKEVALDYVLQEDEVWADGVIGKPKPKVKIKTKKVEKIVEKGLCNDDKLRSELNALYYLDLMRHLPQWPWSFTFNCLKLIFTS